MRSATWIPLLIWLIACGGVLAGAEVVRSTQETAAREHVALLSEQASRRLEDRVRGMLLVVEIVRTELSAGLIADSDAFLRRTETLQQQYRGFQAINWIDADGVIRWVSPVEANRAALGRRVADSPLAAPAIAEARATGLPALSPPLDLFQGGRGLTSYYPVQAADGALRGFVNGVFMVEPLVEQSLRSGILGAYDVEIADGQRQLYSSLDSDAARPDTATRAATVELLGRRWQVSLTPKRTTWDGLLAGSGLGFTLGGLALSTGLAGAVQLALRRQRQREQAIDERRRMEAQLHQSQKMEAVGQLAGGVAHDFNNLLTTMHGNADLVRHSAALEKSEREALEQILLAAERASMLTSQLLTFSRRQIVQPRVIDPNVEIDVLRPMLQRLVRDDVALEFDLEEDLGAIEMDPGQLSQVLINLIVNGSDAIPAGGRLEVRTWSRGVVGRGAPEMVLSVTDDGEGMSEEIRSRAFEPFFTTKPQGKGTGLGLSTVYGIVVGAGGRVEAKSVPGDGTTIEISIPLVSARSLAREPRSSVALRPAEGRVLVVEDEPSVLAVAARLLERAGFTVVEASDGLAALERLDAGERFDLVVTDAVMPEMGGIELLHRIRERGHRCGAVICSGYAQEVAASDLDSLGATFVPKPYTAESLLDAIARARELAS